MTSIALFGTSADPPTVAHKAILEWLATHFDRVRVWAADNPFKPFQTPLSDRQTMLELLVREIQGRYPNVQMCTELSFARTLQSVELARKIWPDATLTLVVGSDVVPLLPKWYRAQELFALVEFLIIPRSGIALLPEDLQQLTEQRVQYQIADFHGPEVSSTYARESGNMGQLPRAIADYIKTHRLYAHEETL